MLDRVGQWMPIKMAANTTPPPSNLYVEGWMPSHRHWISMILHNQKKLGSPLKRIIVSPSGEISLKTIDFEVIHLGSNSIYLNEQIEDSA